MKLGISASTRYYRSKQTQLLFITCRENCIRQRGSSILPRQLCLRRSI
jgi:hypothetical protein